MSIPIGIHYLLNLLLQDVGASEMIADGRIKIKSDSELERFTERGVLFKDGSELEADVIILATGWVSAHLRDKKVWTDVVC